MANLTEELKERAKKLGKTIILPETEDERVLRAAEKVLAEGIAKVALVGNEKKIKEDAEKLGVSLEGAIIYDPENCATIDEMAEILRQKREKKGMTFETAKATLLSDPRFFGAMLVYQGRVDGMVAGSNSPTAHVLRSAILTIGPKPGLKTVSFLSFSTKGSADGESVTKVREAIEILKERNVDFEFDGEFQLDAAIVPEVAKAKAPGSKVAGHANVLIFPDLNSGNIGYKLTQRLAGAKALGPLIQGLASPVHDLSRGCSVEDIVEVVAITAVESEQK